MSKFKKITLSILAIGAIGIAAFLIPTIWFKPWKIDHFYGRVFARFALRHPMMLSGMRLLEPMGLTFHNNDLDDMSMEFQEMEARQMRSELEVLLSFDRDSMSDEAGLSYDVLEWFLEDNDKGNQWMYHNYPVNQLFGIQSGLPDFMINTHYLDTDDDAEDYIARIRQFPRAFDQVIEGLEHRESLGIVPPRFVIDRVLEEMTDFIAPAAEEMVLYSHFATKLSEIEAVSEAKADTYKQELASVLDGTVKPSYQKMIDFFTEQRAIATTDDGVWKLPDGEAFYNHRLRSNTTTDLTANQIHNLGLSEVEKIQTEMTGILESEGYEVENLAVTMNGLNEEERFLYPDTDEGRQQILDDFQSIIDEIDGGLAGLFDVRPESGVQVKRVPEFKEETSPGAYYDSPPFDGSKPGTFFMNLRDVKEVPKFGMRTLAYHEAIPGHHFQIAVAQELQDVAFFRRVIGFTAYSEGWALYTEQLAAEHGFQEDPYDRLGYLTAQLFRAVRLVVDTGIHAKRWTREEAIEYMLENTGMPEGDVVAEIERYIVMPGQACAYKVGQLKILDLRKQAMEALGESFDLGEFHNVVLTNGAVPLSILEELVEAWIAEKGGASSSEVRG